MKKVRTKQVIPPLLLKIRTSKQWSLLDAASRRINVPVEKVESILLDIDPKTLRKNGIWMEKVGKNYIICTNSSFRSHGDDKSCICKDNGHFREDSMKSFFGSTNYNAGRHGKKEIPHKPQCPQWKPPSCGHLHSWRREY